MRSGGGVRGAPNSESRLVTTSPSPSSTGRRLSPGGGSTWTGEATGRCSKSSIHASNPARDSSASAADAWSGTWICRRCPPRRRHSATSAIEQGAPDPLPSRHRPHEQLGDPALESGEVQPPAEVEDADPRCRAAGLGHEGRDVRRAEQRLESRPQRVEVGGGFNALAFPGEGHGRGQVVAAERAELDPVRRPDGQPADRSLRVAQAHRPVKSGLRFSMKAAIPSFWSSRRRAGRTPALGARPWVRAVS